MRFHSFTQRSARLLRREFTKRKQPSKNASATKKCAAYKTSIASRICTGNRIAWLKSKQVEEHAAFALGVY